MSERHIPVEKENDLLDAVIGFLVSFSFFMGIGILAIILQIIFA
ncbi:MAG: YqzM family protein [Candidatus Carbobacillus altaicus]|uniref:YqzM family protein n=1 Tax=Candidatus Carbonibacillus altaicus TaxID=2163959 RepID=A0A2R6Y3E9_9BACL|nr:YqzM family protein [Candidatus Carbobacillus altaicus]PTQ57216.1 MAG: hypothetical protein BSOLF_1981 [Candidatus Carbobacillus altaicus]